MSDPTPIELGEGEALYRAGDLPDEGWEARFPEAKVWYGRHAFSTDTIVVARRIQWTPQPGDRVVQPGDFLGEVIAVHEGWVWVSEPDGQPCTYYASDLSPEQES